jgi:hypothetical protein
VSYNRDIGTFGNSDFFGLWKSGLAWKMGATFPLPGVDVLKYHIVYPSIIWFAITRNGHSGSAVRMRLLDTLVAMEMPAYV